MVPRCKLEAHKPENLEDTVRTREVPRRMPCNPMQGAHEHATDQRVGPLKALMCDVSLDEG